MLMLVRCVTFGRVLASQPSSCSHQIPPDQMLTPFPTAATPVSHESSEQPSFHPAAIREFTPQYEMAPNVCSHPGLCLLHGPCKADFCAFAPRLPRMAQHQTLSNSTLSPPSLLSTMAYNPTSTRTPTTTTGCPHTAKATSQPRPHTAVTCNR